MVFEMCSTGYDHHNRKRLVLLSMPEHVQRVMGLEAVTRIKSIPGVRVIKASDVSIVGQFAQAHYQRFVNEADCLATAAIQSEIQSGYIFPQSFMQVAA